MRTERKYRPPETKKDWPNRSAEMQTEIPAFRVSSEIESQNRKIRNWAEFVIFIIFVGAIIAIAVKIFG